MKTRHAFTLVEMLVVIGIIAIVAALVVGMNSLAQAKKRDAAVNADKAKITYAIDTYQSKLNFYPPDNAALATIGSVTSANFAYYDGLAATNPLVYELTGATNNYQNTGNIMAFDGSSNISSTLYSQVFGGRAAVANASQDEPHNFFQPGPQPKEYTNYYNANYPGTNVWGLIVPVELSPSALNPDGTYAANFWHYDASSPNRHNLNSYDLWAEYITGSQNGSPIITTNGNWK